MSGFFYSTLCRWDSSMLLHVAVACSFSWLYSVSLGEYINWFIHFTVDTFEEFAVLAMAQQINAIMGSECFFHVIIWVIRPYSPGGKDRVAIICAGHRIERIWLRRDEDMTRKVDAFSRSHSSLGLFLSCCLLCIVEKCLFIYLSPH